MKLNIEWPEVLKAHTYGSENADIYIANESGQENMLARCKQAVEKAIKDADKDIENKDVVLEKKRCRECGKIHNYFPSSCSGVKISFWGKDGK